MTEHLRVRGLPAVYHIAGDDGTVYGPLDSSTVQQWIAEGRVRPDSLAYGGASAEWVPLSQHPDFAGDTSAAGASAPPAASGTARPRNTHLIAKIAAAVLVGVLVIALIVAGAPLARSGRWALLPDVVAGGLRGGGGAAPHPEAPMRSDAPAVRETPLPGIEIRADAGALDRERTFSATPMTAEQLVPADAKLLDQGLIALGGYDIDAGMTETDLFYEPATITFDLEDLGIPEALWSETGVSNIAADGTVMLVSSQLKGSKLVFETRHNGPWMIVLVPSLLGTMTYAWVKDRAELPKGDFAAIHWKPDDIRFRVMYPRSWPARKPAEVKKAQDELARLIAAHKLSWADLKIAPKTSEPADSPPTIAVDPFSDVRDIAEQMGERIDRLQELEADPEYLALREVVESEEWLKENLLPPRVTNAVIGLDRGYEYLDSRGFRKPGVAKYSTTTDVFIVDKSLGKELFGEVHNTWTTSPFMVLDGTKIPDADLSALSAEQKAAYDEYQLTAVHELFHVVQSAYVFLDRNTYLWFNEATAALLEREAEQHYTTDKKYATTWKMTLRSYDSFFQPMEFFDPDKAKPNQQHGYGQSYFMEYVRDYYFTTSGARNAFLPALYEDFARLRGGAIESLYRTTGGTPESLSSAFYAFTYVSGGDLQTAYIGMPKGPLKISTTLDRGSSPTYVMRFFEGGRPLSTQLLQVDVAGGGSSASPSPTNPVYVLKTNGVENDGAIVRLDTPAQGMRPWDEIKDGCVLPAKSRLYVMRAETYIKTPDAIRNAGQDVDTQGPVVFGMFSENAPAVEVKDQVVTIDWKPSGAASVKRADGTRALISGYRVTLVTPDGRKTTFASDEPHVELPVEVVDKIVQAAKRSEQNKVFKALHGIGEQDMITLINMSEALSAGLQPMLQVSYQEVAAIPGSPLGPPSSVTTFEYGDEARDKADVTGTWAGSVPFSEGNLMRLDLVQQGGGDIIGTMRWGDDIPIRGKWDSATRSWSLEGRESNVWMPMFLVFNGHLQKLPGDKLYMFAPPAVLSRHSSSAPDLGWTPEPEDMDLDNLLQQLQQELDQMPAPEEGATP